MITEVNCRERVYKKELVKVQEAWVFKTRLVPDTKLERLPSDQEILVLEASKTLRRLAANREVRLCC